MADGSARRAGLTTLTQDQVRAVTCQMLANSSFPNEGPDHCILRAGPLSSSWERKMLPYLLPPHIGILNA